MKRLKLFPKTFLYTLTLMVFVVITAHILMYLLAPKMGMVISTTDNITDEIVVGIREEKIVIQAIQKALPFSLFFCLVISVICSLLFSKAIVSPIKKISACTEQMMKLDRTANCSTHSKDEIGLLAQNVNKLYSNLLSTIEHLEQEKDRVSEMERSKVDFLRAASHELKTPVTALNATLENMILGVGKYKDYDVYLPECKEMTEQLADMIHDILETSKLSISAEREETIQTDLSKMVSALCEPYILIAKAKGIVFQLELSDDISAILPQHMFEKAVSNILANAVAYTETGKIVSVYFDDNNLIIENECDPIPPEILQHLFEPFYRPDFARNRENGGNGLGLYIVTTLFDTIGISYSFVPMKNPKGMRFTINLI